MLPSRTRVFYNALKMRDPHRVLIGANYGGDLGDGPAQLWEWQTNTLHTLGDASTKPDNNGTYSSHDAQFVSAHDYAMHIAPYLGRHTSAEEAAADATATNGSHDRVWRPDLEENFIYAMDAVSGDIVNTVGPFDHRTFDINHFQVLHRASICYITWRCTTLYYIILHYVNHFQMFVLT